MNYVEIHWQVKGYSLVETQCRFQKGISYSQNDKSEEVLPD